MQWLDSPAGPGGKVAPPTSVEPAAATLGINHVKTFSGFQMTKGVESSESIIDAARRLNNDGVYHQAMC